MPDYTQYNREDFLANESFTNYLLQKNAADIRFWQNWIAENPQCSHEVAEAKLLFSLIREAEAFGNKQNNQAETDRQYAEFITLLKEKGSVSGGKLFQIPINKRKAERARFNKMVWKCAGVAAVLLLAVSLWIYFGTTQSEPSKTAFALFAKTGSIAKTITLPDGSIVQLNTFSSIALAKNFNAEKRDVLLTGSALFNVHKDHAKPFDVTTGSITTTALGTSFYISNLHPETLSVSLLEGKVRVEGTQNYVELSPGEKAVAYEGTRIYKHAFPRTHLADFAAGKINFEKANLRELKTVLEEFFNVTILIKGASPELNFTGSFDTKNIQTVLDALQFTYNIKYNVKGQNVIVSFD